jgi:hypothetical protein
MEEKAAVLLHSLLPVLKVVGLLFAFFVFCVIFRRTRNWNFLIKILLHALRTFEMDLIEFLANGSTSNSSFRFYIVIFLLLLWQPALKINEE